MRLILVLKRTPNPGACTASESGAVDWDQQRYGGSGDVPGWDLERGNMGHHSMVCPKLLGYLNGQLLSLRDLTSLLCFASLCCTNIVIFESSFVAFD
jgi:hypothetical protein